jgi:hypothetical protein
MGDVVGKAGEGQRGFNLVCRFKKFDGLQTSSLFGKGIERFYFGDLSRFVSIVVSDDVGARSIFPIINKVDENASDATILDAVDDLVIESICPLPAALSIPNANFVEHKQPCQYVE